MKTLLKVLGTIVVCMAVLLFVLSITGFGPHGTTPGLWLKGELVTTPVTYWTFADQYQTLAVQTHTRYLIPHSVTTYGITYQGHLYLTSIYRYTGLEYPHGRSWNEDVARDPRVRIRIGDKLYDRSLVVVTDAAEKAIVLKAKSQKYPDQKILPNWVVILFRVQDN